MGFKYYEDIRNLCNKHSKLNEEDIQQLEVIAEELLNDEMHAEKDIFIDVKDELTNEAVVVFHRFPRTGESLYKNMVVGKVAFRKDEPGPLRTLETGQHSQGLFAQTQEGLIIKQNVSAIISKQKVIGVIIIEEDLSEQIKDTFDLTNSEKNIVDVQEAFSELNSIDDTITDNLDDIIFMFDLDGKLKYHNKAAKSYYQTFGYKNQLDNLDYDNLTLDKLTFDQVMYDFTVMNRTKIEKNLTFNNRKFVSKTIYLEEKQMILLILIENKISLTEESMHLLDNIEIQEIHHRVKNNLQAIISILRLQSRRVKSEESRKVLMESVNRVLAISATHELLSKQKKSDVEVALVLDRVLDNLKRVYMEDKQIKLRVNVDRDIILDSNRAVILSLIINEIIQNSFEHAFINKKKSSEIYVEASQNGTWIEVVIKDNGVGFNIEEVDESRLGLQIVKSFVSERLNGNLEITSVKNKGTTFQIKFNRVDN
ncbi:sensor histidine kinase [Facklamia lactis]|uniref:sensor histidine kinase n=1 Tax=Facklamia lactis TaxID=2749967 RepID=UPI0018CD1C44|nr:sensor histidine kinase [Facklamia lactis]MBG9979476.1 sensor histidine kinase [Facklamia lactis]